MLPSATHAKPALASSALANNGPVKSERAVFAAIAAAMTASMLVGFAPTYYLRPLDLGTPARLPGTALIAAHGAVFTAFMLLFLVQSLLVARGKVGLHRVLGVAGLPLLAAMVPLAVLVGIDGVVRRSGPPVVTPVAWLAWVLGDVAAFAGLIGAGLYWRRRAAVHKRLMTLGAAVMMGPAMGRALAAIPIPGPAKAIGPPLLIGLILLAWDFRARGRPHPATAWGFSFLAATMVLRIPVMFSPWWPPLGEWLVRTIG